MLDTWLWGHSKKVPAAVDFLPFFFPAIESTLARAPSIMGRGKGLGTVPRLGCFPVKPLLVRGSKTRSPHECIEETIFRMGASLAKFLKTGNVRHETVSTDCFSVLLSSNGGLGLFSSWIHTPTAFLF